MITTTHRSVGRKTRVFAALVVAAAGVILLMRAPATASATSLAGEERQGKELLRQVEAGTRSCGELGKDDFEVIGDYVMGRMVGSTEGHRAMDEMMDSMMGERANQQMHVFMGERFSGCRKGAVPQSFGGMMGDGDGFMGFDNGGGDDDWSAATIVMTVLMVLLVVGVAVALVAVLRPRARSGGQTPLEVLQARFARGEIDADEYERRRQALGG